MDKRFAAITAIVGSVVIASTVCAQTADTDARVRQVYRGSWREAAKTSLVPGPSAACAPLSDILQSLPRDDDMRRKYPMIGDKKPEPADRTPEEAHNVCAIAYIQAAKVDAERESDNDINFILGADAAGGLDFMTIEVTGLPKKGDTAPFEEARKQALAVLATAKFLISERGGGYTKLVEPIKVQVTGSLFFHGKHEPGAVGPPGARPLTVWEIHPVQTIKRI